MTCWKPPLFLSQKKKEVEKLFVSIFPTILKNYKNYTFSMVNFDTVLELLTSTPFFLNISCPMLVKNESVAKEFCVLNG